MKLKPRFLVLGALLFLGVSISLYGEYHALTKKPSKLGCNPKCNVIVIIEDALAAGHLKTYGYDRDTMPQTTAFFEKHGVIFEQAHSVSPWTLPSFMSMYYSDLANNITYRDLEQAKRTNLIALLRDAGVTPIRAVVPLKGFFIYDMIEKPYLADELVPMKDGSVFAAGKKILQKQPTPDAPFFLLLHSLKIHDPYEPASPYNAEFGSSSEYPKVTMQALRGENAKPEILASTTEIFKLRYDQGIRQEDAVIADFLNSLSPELLATTVIIFTSDHGEAFGEHGKYWHAGSLYQEELHVPLMIAAPNLTPRRIQDPVSTLDFAPTILSIMNAPVPETLLGDDLTPLMFGGTLGERTLRFVNGLPSFLDLSPGKEPPFISLSSTGKEGTHEPIIIPTQRGLRIQNMKLITMGEHGPVTIFDLQKDPSEQDPLSTSDKRIPASFLSAFLRFIYPSCGGASTGLEACTKSNTNR